RGTIAFTLGVGLFAAIFGVLAASVLISPLTDLVKGLRQLVAGNPGDRIDRAASGEISEALCAYNEICARLHRDPEALSFWAKLWTRQDAQQPDREIASENSPENIPEE
ncbi:MAG TPA: hypothetical protein PKC25_09950, partial [Candidatus Rifleibacterium sp.]|nr:hypothetical protein [Candidatus Rifleibacterium sp.]